MIENLGDSQTQLPRRKSTSGFSRWDSIANEIQSKAVGAKSNGNEDCVTGAAERPPQTRYGQFGRLNSRRTHPLAT